MAAGGSGSALLVAIEKSIETPNTKLILQALVPWIASLIGIFAPYVRSMIVAQAKYLGVRFFLWRARRQAKKTPGDREHAVVRKKALDNIIELEKILIELNAQGAKRIVEIGSG